MFSDEHAPLALLVELTPKLAKRKFKESIYTDWNYRCAYCEDFATSLDHIIPRFKSGTSNRNNLIPACRRCNSNKGSTPVEQWYIQQDFYTQARMEKIKTWMSQDITDIFSFYSARLQLAI